MVQYVVIEGILHKWEEMKGIKYGSHPPRLQLQIKVALLKYGTVWGEIEDINFDRRHPS